MTTVVTTLPIRVRLSDGTTADISVSARTIVSGAITERRALTAQQFDEARSALAAHMDAVADNHRSL